jgi:5S rRNA maturation endonuclease (ribonuclease M5)
MTTAGLPSIQQIAELLGGEVRGNQVCAPGPGHSVSDRSLSVLIDASAPDGFVIHSFAGDDAIACRDYVRDRLGLPAFEAKKKKANGKANGKWWPLAEYVYRDANGEPYLLVKKYLDANGKKQFPQFHWDGKQWLEGKPAGPKIPYNLPQMIAAPTAVIYVCEGEKDADALTNACLVATTASEGAGAKWPPELTPHFKDRRVVILPDADEPGRKHAQKVAKALYDVAASIKVVDLFPDRSDGQDVSDWLKHDAVAAKLFKAVEAAPEWQSATRDEPMAVATAEDETEESEVTTEIARLAKLPAIKYEQERKVTSQALGFRASILDQLVQAERDRNGGGDGRRLQGRAVELPEPKPSDDPVDGASLLNEIVKALETYIVLSKHAARSCAVWTVYTFLAEHFLVSPRLCISSPVMGCGKSTLTDILSRLVLRPLKASNATSASIFRVIEMHKPCLLIDEGDTFVKLSEELRGILNSGHRHDGAVLRVVGDELEPRLFATFSPCSVALIGELPPTLADRSIPVGLKRRRPADGVVRSFSLNEVGHLDVLARQSARWAEDHAVEIAATRPEMPNGIINRARDNWSVLKAIATVAGGDWPDYIDAAALAAQARTGEETSRLEQLLADIKAVAFLAGKNGDVADEVRSADLVAALVALEARPWAEMGKNDKPLTQNKLARMLKPLQIAPEYVGPEGSRARGYKRERFGEAFERYLGVSELCICAERDEMGTSCISEVCSPDDGCTPSKCEKPNNDGLLHGRTVEKVEMGDQGHERVCCAAGTPDDQAEVPQDQPDEIPTDRTCAQCKGEIDGTERLVSVSGQAVWLHAVCKRFWLRTLEGRER